MRHLNKADRAAALDLGEDVVRLHRGAAERTNRLAQRQFSALIARIDDRLGQADWSELVERVRREFEERDGQQVLEDAKAHVRAAVLELDGVSAPDAKVFIQLFDETADRATSDGLDGVVHLLRDRMEHGLSAVQSPEMGRQEGSPQSANTITCVAGAWAVTIAALVACAFVPFCWCCFAWAIFLGLSALLTICALTA